MKMRRRDPIRAFSLFELLVVIAVLMLVAAVLLTFSVRMNSALNNGRTRAVEVTCMNNLKQVGLSFKMWASDNEDKYPMQVSVTNAGGGTMEFITNGLAFVHFQILSNELNNPRVLHCPSDTNRFPAADFTIDFDNTRLSYFVGLDADETQPAMLLSGDRNITNGTPVRHGILELTTNRVAGWTHEIHNGKGNILLTDGSVQQIGSEKLNFLLQNSGMTTNRLLMP